MSPLRAQGYTGKAAEEITGTTRAEFPAGWVDNFSTNTNFVGVTEMNTDPVCGMKVDPNKSQFESQYGGKTFNFCSKECKTKFDQQPEQYATSAA